MEHGWLSCAAGVYGRPLNKTPESYHGLGLAPFKGDFFFFNAYQEDFRTNRCRPLIDVAGYDQLSTSVAFHEGTSPRDNGTLSTTDTSHMASLTGLYGHSPAVFPEADPFEVQLFDFYIHSLCPNLSNSPTQNPYLEFIAPLATTSTPLYHSVLSWSARELSFRNPNDHRCSQASINHKVQALRGLRNDVESSQAMPESSSSTLISILSTMIILSCQEIVESCSSAWVAHLKAARMLCSVLWPKNHDTPDNFRKFCVMWFVSHEIMSRTAWIQETLFEPSEWFAGDDETEIDAMIGCSRGLIHQVSEIGSLIMEKRKGMFNEENKDSLLARRDRIEAALRRLGQRISTTAGSAPPELLEVAESKRLCALIYLYTCIDDALPSTPIIHTMTRRVMKILAKLPPKPSLTFPLFVVGTLGVWNEHDRRLVLDKFSCMINARPLASIVRASEIVQAVWLDRDLGKCERWEDLVETRGKLLSLA